MSRVAAPNRGRSYHVASRSSRTPMAPSSETGTSRSHRTPPPNWPRRGAGSAGASTDPAKIVSPDARSDRGLRMISSELSSHVGHDQARVEGPGALEPSRPGPLGDLDPFSRCCRERGHRDTGRRRVRSIRRASVPATPPGTTDPEDIASNGIRERPRSIHSSKSMGIPAATTPWKTRGAVREPVDDEQQDEVGVWAANHDKKQPQNPQREPTST